MVSLNFTHGGDVHSYKKGTIDFSANINPLGIPEKVRERIVCEIDNLVNYPPISSEKVVKQLSLYWGISKDNIIVGNGSAELIYLILNSYQPKTVGIPAPSFSEYERAARSVKAKLSFLPIGENNGFKLDLAGVNTDMLIVGNPNNPTGNLLLKPKDRVKAKMTVVDEAFMDFVPSEKEHSFITTAVKDKKFSVLRTFTKFFSLPGLRIGYLISHKDNIKLLKQKLVPWNVNHLAQVAAVAMLKGKSYIRQSRDLVGQEREFLIQELPKIASLKVFDSRVNFLLIKLNGKVTSTQLANKLIEKSLLIRDCSNFRGLSNKFIRVAVRDRAQNIKLIKALGDIL